MTDPQEIAALLFVALVAGIALWRRYGRKRPSAGCTGCGPASDKPREAVIQFHPRR